MNSQLRQTVAIGLLACGCGGGAGGEQPGGGGTSGGGDSNSGGTSAASGASGGTSSGDGGAPGTGGASGSGPVLRSLTTGSRGSLVFYHNPFWAETLFDAVYANQDLTCTYTEVGQCHRTSCPLSETGQRLDAGTVTITSPDVTGEVVATYSGPYTVTTSTLETLLGGEGIVASVAGSSLVPAHTVLGSYSPLVVLDSPSATAPVTRDSELVLAFSRAEGGAVFAAQAGWNTSSSRELVICSAVGNPGTLTIDASLMELMNPGTAIELFTVTPTEAQAEEFSVDLKVVGPAVNPELSAAVELSVQ